MVAFFFFFISSVLAIPLHSLTQANELWYHPYSPIKIKNLVENPQGNPSLTTTIFDSRQWDILSTISYENLSAGTIFKPTFVYRNLINMQIGMSSSRLLLNISLGLMDNSLVRNQAHIVFNLSNTQKQVIFNYGRDKLDHGLMTPFYIDGNLVTSGFNVDQQGNIWIQQSLSLNYYNKSIDIMEILRKLCQLPLSPLSCNQNITSMYFDFNFETQYLNQAGTVSFNMTVTKYCKTGSFRQIFQQFTLDHDASSSTSDQYGKVCHPYVSLSFVQYSFEYEYSNTSSCQNLKAFTFLDRGLDSECYGDNQTFPVNHTEKSIKSSFSFQMDARNSSVKAEACYIIELRDDYDPVTGQFGYQLGSQQIDINVCRWSNVHPNSTATWVNINGNDYAYHHYAVDNIYYYIDDNDLDLSYRRSIGSWDLNLSLFIEKVGGLERYLIASVKRGFRVYCGRVNFVIKETNFNIILNQPTSTPNTSNTSNSSNTSNTSNSSNTSTAQTPPTPTQTNTTNPQPPFTVSQQVNTAVSSTVSVPNIGLILKLAQLLNTLDDLSYFTYHNTTYDTAFAYIADLSWGWTNSKWTPPMALQSQIGINLSSGYEPGWVGGREGVGRFRVKGERMAFLDNCKGFMIYTVPSSVLIFLILWKLYWKFKDYKLASVLKAFSSWAYLIVSLVCDNNQYLSFRSFQQLRSLQPTTSLPSLLSQTLSIFTLFTSVFCSFALFPLTHTLSNTIFRPPTLLRFLPSIKYLLISTISRFLSGFVHAMIDQPLIRILLLLLLQLIMAVSSLLSWHCTRFKTPHTVMIVGQVARTALYLTVTVEVAFPSVVREMGGVSTLLVEVVFAATVLQIVMAVVVGAVVVPRDFQFGRGISGISGQGWKQKKQSVLKAAGHRVANNGRLIQNTQIIHIKNQANTRFQSLNKKIKKVEGYNNHLKKKWQLYLFSKYSNQMSAQQINIINQKKTEKRKGKSEDKSLFLKLGVKY